MTEPHDPTGLIREVYRIEGIDAGQCRSIFLDWALGLPPGTDPQPQVRALLAKYADQPADHPMTEVLRAAQEPAPAAKRRGGWAGRRH